MKILAALHFKTGLLCTEKPFLGFVMLLLIPPTLPAFHTTQAIYALDRLHFQIFFRRYFPLLF